MPSTVAANRLLEALPATERGRLLDHCEPVELHFAAILAEAGEPIREVWFPIRCAIVQVARIDGHANLEVGLVGDEGALGASLVLDVAESPQQALVQEPGEALRIEAGRFRRELARSPALTRVLRHYIHAQMGQLAQTAGCTRFHVVEARLARWLLMTQDRAHSSQFHLTHEFLANVLGVRRVGITRAATTLQNRRLIRYARGDITVTDRAGLEAAACGCYAADKVCYQRSMAMPAAARTQPQP